jgi:hypothetical protein
MKKNGRILKTAFLAITMIAALLSLTVATYAWFSANKVVKTEAVTAKSGSDDLTLQLSSKGGNSFSGDSEASITQVNSSDLTELLPVSTTDLATFLYNDKTVDGMASNFSEDSEANRYYHGRIYLRAQAEGQPSTAKAALYLDQSSSSGGSIVQSDDENLLAATRLGLSFNTGDSVIFKLSDSDGNSSNQVFNTVVDGITLSDNQVIGLSGSKVKAFTDPAVSLSKYTITINDSSVSLPEEPILYMDLNTIYTLDIYYYLEGCDPDCSDSVSFSDLDLHLAFYAVLEL